MTCSKAAFIHQSGPLRTAAQKIFTCRMPIVQSCHGKKIGVWFFTFHTRCIEMQNKPVDTLAELEWLLRAGSKCPTDREWRTRLGWPPRSSGRRSRGTAEWAAWAGHCSQSGRNRPWRCICPPASTRTGLLLPEFGLSRLLENEVGSMSNLITSLIFLGRGRVNSWQACPFRLTV